MSMKKRGGARKRGRPRLPMPRPEPPDVEDREVMTLQRVADYLHCHYSTASRLPHRGDIPSFRLGGGRRFLKSDVDEWIANGGGRK